MEKHPVGKIAAIGFLIILLYFPPQKGHVAVFRSEVSCAR